MRSKLTLAVAATLLLGGCVTLGPDYHRPPAPLLAEDHWAFPPTLQTLVLDAAWWEAFGDPALDTLIVDALANNNDVLLAAARLAEAEALARRAGAERLPSLGVDASASKGDSVSGFGGLSGESDPTITTTRRALAATIDLELDLFGRLRRADEAAAAELAAQEETVRAVELAVSAAVARAYIDVIGLQLEHRLLMEAMERRGAFLELQQQRFAAGVIAGVDLDRAEAEYHAASAALPQSELAERLALQRLLVLLGRPPIDIVHQVTLGTGLPKLPEVPAGLPSELLERRPDLLAAERRLAAATARIGVAKAELFPRLSLTGDFGRESLELGSFVSASSGVWNASAQLLGSIFGFGRGKARVAAAEARAEQALITWRQSILDAFAEVEGALAERQLLEARRLGLEGQATALERVLAAEQQRYEAGDSSALELLDAERSLLSSRSAALAAERQTLLASVDLMVALGGGWASKSPASNTGAAIEPTDD